MVQFLALFAFIISGLVGLLLIVWWWADGRDDGGNGEAEESRPHRGPQASVRD